MKTKIHRFLVNRHSGIRQRYHRMHDGAQGAKKILSWVYLLWLNFCYYVLLCRFLGKSPQAELYEQKRIPLQQSESALAAEKHLSVQALIEKLSQYDVISFDIFDTLLFRPFSEPTDLFFFIGEKLAFMDFKRIRTETEAEARMACIKKYGHSEITIQDIWERMERKTGLSAEKGIALELSLESQFCYANPFMQQVYQALLEKGKKIILISDMYLPQAFLKQMLEGKGFTGMDALYVSCEYGKNKVSGSLYELVKQALPPQARVIHVGDNPVSDKKMAEKHGFDAYLYPNVNQSARPYRASDMSPIIGGAYRGIVNNTLYNGAAVHSMEYEYGFVYGGLFVLGYCNFIHEYYQKNGLDKVLFLSRDGDILKQVYDRLFPQDSTAYAYWSRAAANKLMAAYDKHDYFRRYLYYKVNQNYSIRQIFASMELESLLERFSSSKAGAGLQVEQDVLTDHNIKAVIRFLEDNWDAVLQIYEEQQAAAKAYYSDMLNSCKKACAVDIGWAGSGAMALSYLTENVWGLPCRITGLIAGTNTIYNVEPDASEMFLQSGKLVAYLYSRAHNVDLMKKHDLHRDYNVFWELLLSSPTKQFKGFSFAEDRREIQLSFGKADPNVEGMREIQQGVLDFAAEYEKHFGTLPYMRRISGRDAYAPMLAASGHKEAYLKTIAAKFHLDVHVE